MSKESYIPKSHCPSCNSYLGDIKEGTPYCNKCKAHVVIKECNPVKMIDRMFYKGTKQ